MSEWKDDDRSSTLGLTNLRISIHRHIHYEKDDWLLSVRGLPIDCKVLDSKDLEDAKAESETKVLSMLSASFEELSRLQEQKE